jgi:hypothetical protein
MAVNINVPSQVKTYTDLAAFPASGALKTIYIAEDTNKTYRWTGSVYVEVSSAGASGITIGTTAITSGTVGRVLFEGTGNVVQESANLFWDDTNGRLGIGTSTPAQTLDVVGVAKFNQNGTSVILNNPSGRYTDLGFSNADSIKSFVSLDNSQFYLDIFNSSNYGLRLWTNNAERMRIPTTGNVLINTTTDAGYKLDVNGTARVQNTITLTGINTPNNANLPLALGNFTLDVQTTNPNTATGSIITTGAITKTDSGVKSIIKVNNAVTSTAANFNTLNGFAFTSTINQTLGTIRGIYIAPTLTASTDFRAIETTAGNVIFNGGNVGIGTSSPAYPLHITRNSSSNYIQLSGNSNKGLFAEGSGLIAFDTSGNFNVYTGGVNLRATISSGGNVLIGTTTDAGYKLDVNGTARVQGTGTGTANSFVVQNSASVQTFRVNDLGQVQIGRTTAINWTFSSNSLTSSQYAYILSNNGSVLSTSGVGGVLGNNTGAKICDQGVGSSNQVASAVLECNSTTRGFLPPRLTTTQKNDIAAPATGLQVHDTTLNRPCFYDGTTWITL